jgi:hypothetical protein
LVNAFDWKFEHLLLHIGDEVPSDDISNLRWNLLSVNKLKQMRLLSL